MRSKKFITCYLFFKPLDHCSMKKFPPVDCDSSQNEKFVGCYFVLLVYWDSGWYGVPYFRCRPRECVFSLQHDDTHGTWLMTKIHEDSGHFGKNMAADVSQKNVPKRLRLKTFAETFRMICGAYPVYARSLSPSQRPAPTTIASGSPFPLGLCSCSTSLSKMGI